MGQQSGVAPCSRSHSWGALALPITRGALPPDSECYEERAWSLPTSSQQTETGCGESTWSRPSLHFTVWKKLRGQGLAQGHGDNPQARQGWMQALDSWQGAFLTLSALKQFRWGGSSAVPEETPGLSRIRSESGSAVKA